MMASSPKNNVLVIGGGAVGTIAALNLEIGGLATVSLVLRSNFDVVNQTGYTIESCDHGSLSGWKPSQVLPGVPRATESASYDYIVLTTKNIPDVPPTVVDLLRPIISRENRHTVLVLIQNGLNIEKPLIAAYPSTPILSGVSLIGSAETAAGTVIQDDRDRLLIGAFKNPNIPDELSRAAAEEFVKLYGAGGKTDCIHSPNVIHDRWRKLVYNACLNPICAITGLDTGRIRLADDAVNGLVKPAMREIVAAAKALGVELGDEVVDYMVNIDPLDLYLSPSMLADVGKGNFIEFENLLGEPLREGKAAGVSMPTLEVLYNLCKVVQWRTKEARGLVQIPPKRGTAQQ